MTALDNAIYIRMASDATLVGLISSLKSLPAIATQEPIPAGMVPPYIAVMPALVSPNDTKTHNGRLVVRDINCYQRALGDPSVVDAIAERIRALFHRYQLSVSGYDTMMAEAGGPTRAETDKTLYGRTITLRLTLWDA